MSSWQSFNSEAYVDRPGIIMAIENWVDNLVNDKQVLSLLGPPGSGKTWVLHALEAKWMNKRLVLWLDISSVINLAEKNIKEQVLNEDRVLKWLGDVLDLASSYCHRLPEYHTNMSPSKVIDLLVEETCQNSDLDFRPVVLVDGFDDIEPSQAEVVCDRILIHFLGDICWRLIIARREQRPLLHYRLRNNEAERDIREALRRQLSVSTTTFAREQFTKFQSTYYPGASITSESLTEWIAALSEYRWGHPFINAYLFNIALLAGTNWLQPLSKDHLKNCFKMTFRRGNSSIVDTPNSPLSAEDVSVLEKIACDLDETWTEHELEAKLGIKYFGETIERIFDNGLIIEAGAKSRKKIPDGIRQLLREIHLH